MLGGGTFTTQDKILPGAYINFVSAARARAVLSERGTAAIALEADWGPEDVFTISSENRSFQQDVERLFGYTFWHDKLKGVRDLFARARVGHFYRLGTGGAKAQNPFAVARYSGVRGNALQIVIEPGEAESTFDVSVYLDTTEVNTQTVTSAADLIDNDYVTFIKTATLAPTAGTPLTGGTNGVLSNGDYQTFLDNIESYTFNALGCTSSDDTVKGLFAAFTKRMRDEVGMKFQCVIHKYPGADFEGIVSVENNEAPDMVYWVTGALAGCAINRSLTNSPYDGEFDVNVGYTQEQLENAILGGKFIFHRVGDIAHVLEDINTLRSFTETKSEDFASNQTIRVLDQIATDTAALFATRYLGIIPNDQAGRISLWNDIVSHRREMERIRAIEEFDPSDVTVVRGDHKKSVVVSDKVTPVNAMSQLYMTVVVE